MRKTSLNLARDWMDFCYTVITPDEAYELLRNAIVPMVYTAEEGAFFLLDKGFDARKKTADIILHIGGDPDETCTTMYEMARVGYDRLQGHPWVWKEDLE